MDDGASDPLARGGMTMSTGACEMTTEFCKTTL